MANESTNAPFARDLGYLDKFFANLSGHAESLPQAQGDRLKQLIAEEVVRWKEIRQLLGAPAGNPPAPAAVGGAPAKPAQEPAAATGTPAKPVSAPAATTGVPVKPVPASVPASAPAASSAPAKSPAKFTVGSLLGQPKK